MADGASSTIAELPVVRDLSDEELLRADDDWLAGEIRRVEAALSRWIQAAGIRQEPGRDVASVASVASAVVSTGETWWYEFYLVLHAPHVGEEGEDGGYHFVVWIGSGEHPVRESDRGALRPIYRTLPVMIWKVAQAVGSSTLGVPSQAVRA
jgi:hypothetical protein